MYKPEINAFHHPTTTVFIDDNADFLYSIALGVDRLPYRSFGDPREALAYVDSFADLYYSKGQQAQFAAANPSELKNSAYPALSQRMRAKCQQKLDDPRRFAEPSVLVVDYSMPKLNGLDLCSQIVNPNIKKVLLTGVADEKVAIDALNTETIDFYISKSEASLSQRLRNIIGHLENRYFQDLYGWTKDVSMGEDLPYLFDASFADFFEDTCERLEIIEHYPLAEPGGLTLVNRYGMMSQLVVITEAEFVAIEERAQNVGLAAGDLEVMRRRAAVPYPHKPLRPGADLYPVTAMDGPTNYYCLLIPYETLKREIGEQAAHVRASYNDFLQPPSILH